MSQLEFKSTEFSSRKFSPKRSSPFPSLFLPLPPLTCLWIGPCSGEHWGWMQRGMSVGRGCTSQWRVATGACAQHKTPWAFLWTQHATLGNDRHTTIQHYANRCVVLVYTLQQIHCIYLRLHKHPTPSASGWAHWRGAMASPSWSVALCSGWPHPAHTSNHTQYRLGSNKIHSPWNKSGR